MRSVPGCVPALPAALPIVSGASTRARSVAGTSTSCSRLRAGSARRPMVPDCRAQLRQRLLGVLEADRRHPEGARALAVDVEVVEEDAFLRTQPLAEALERQLVDLRLGLAHADEGGVDDQLEDLV